MTTILSDDVAFRKCGVLTNNPSVPFGDVFYGYPFKNCQLKIGINEKSKVVNADLMVKVTMLLTTGEYL